MDSAEIRTRFLRYFAENGHEIVPSASLLLDDPTLLFVNAFAPDLFLPGFLHPLYDFSKDITEVIVLLMVLGFVYRRLVVQPARIHYSGEALLILSFIGVYSLRNSFTDCILAAGFGVLGFVLSSMQRGAAALARAPLSADEEAAIPAARGMIVRWSPTEPSNWRQTETLDTWLKRHSRIGNGRGSKSQFRSPWRPYGDG